MSYKNIGFIGTGIMGSSMISHLINAGYTLHIFNRTKEKAEKLIQKGAIWHSSPSEVAKSSECIITMVGYPKDVEDVYFGKTGILQNAHKGSVLIDMSTSSPLLAKKIYDEALGLGLNSLDAPVSGGDIGAQKATLAIMVGGDEQIFELAKPIFEVLGKSIILQGSAGAGQHTKMANQITIASTLFGVCESIHYAKSAGLDPSRVIESISTGAASSWQLYNLGVKMIAQDFNPGFYVKHFLKDLRIALDSTREMNICLPFTQMAEDFFCLLNENGKSDLGTQAAYLLYQENIFDNE